MNPPSSPKTGIIIGTVTDSNGNITKAANIIATDKAGKPHEIVTNNKGEYKIVDLPPGKYKISIQPPSDLKEFALEQIVEVKADSETTADIKLSSSAFASLLGVSDFDIETPISDAEALSAARLFRVVAMLMAGRSSQSTNGQENTTDLFGILKLKSRWKEVQKEFVQADDVLNGRIEATKPNSPTILTEINRLAAELNVSQAPKDLLLWGRQNFNLGDPSAVGNVRFPGIFNRLLELLNDPLASLDIADEKGKDRTGIDDINRAYDVLREIKGLVLKLVRSLAHHGSESYLTAVAEMEDFFLQEKEGYRTGALMVLNALGKMRNAEDDQKNAWSVLSLLTERPREPDIISFVALGRRGGNILDGSVALYVSMQGATKLDAESDEDMVEIFQPAGAKDKRKDWFVLKMRPDAALLKRYPVSLPEWQ